jgi:hypothetical protein
MSNRPKLQILIGLTDLRYNSKTDQITDSRYKANSQLKTKEDWENAIPNLESLKKHVPAEDHYLLSYHEEFFGKNPENKSFIEHIEWDSECGLGNVIGIRVSLGVYATDELYALASCYVDFAQAGFRVLGKYNPLKNTTGSNCNVIAYALMRELGFDIKKEDLKMMLYWNWG